MNVVQAHDRPRYQDPTSYLNNGSIPSIKVGAGTKKYNPLANAKSVFDRNVVDSIQVKGATCPEPPCALPGTYSANVVYTETPFDIRAELRDPYHLDFRPCPGSTIAAAGAGAYEVWSVNDTVYRIPGRRRLALASTPVPPSGSTEVHTNSDLMFAPARAAVEHMVYLRLSAGGGGVGFVLIASLGAEAGNIVHSPLAANGEYEWRVDTRLASGATVAGDVWSLTTGSAQSCKIPPAPAPPAPPPPSPADCPAAEAKACPGQAGKGAACSTCVIKNSKVLEAAVCWTDTGHGGRHAFIEKWCFGQ